MFGMDCMDDEEFLSLKLSIVTNYNGVRKRKRDRSVNSNCSSSTESYEESKIFALLQMREQMLKVDHHHRIKDKGLHLIHLLLVSATSINTNDVTSGVENLSELYRNACLTGDSVQRVAAYFADGLVAKLLTRKSPFYETIMKTPTRDEEFLAFTYLYKASPLHQFAHFTANQAILEAFEREENANNRALHVVDFDISYGFQWPSLMQSLSENATPTNRVSLKITGFSTNMEDLQETKSRLVSFAKGFQNLVFEFHGLVRGGSKTVKIKRKRNETLAVNLVFHLSSLNSFSKISETLNYVYSLNPSIVVLVEQGSRNSYNFLPRFMDSLHYFAAIFDSLDDCLPLDSAERLSIEKNHLGKEIRSMINYDNDEQDKCTRFEKMEAWKGRMESHGFQGIKQSCKSVMQAKLLLKIRSHCSIKFNEENGGFRVFERDNGKSISLGWQERLLVTATSWCSTV